jgi:hypothetical protein
LSRSSTNAVIAVIERLLTEHWRELEEREARQQDQSGKY